MRSGWGEADSLLHLHCGTMGAGHGHSDQLHVDLYANGEDILTDSGRYTYVDGPDRREFKDPSAHNTITVDVKPFTVYKDSWECSKLCQPVKQEMAVKEGMALAQGGHLGYLMGPGDGAISAAGSCGCGRTCFSLPTRATAEGATSTSSTGIFLKGAGCGLQRAERPLPERRPGPGFGLGGAWRPGWKQAGFPGSTTSAPSGTVSGRSGGGRDLPPF